MTRKKLLVSLLLATIMIVILAPLTAEAIPAFARTHKISCTTCHAPFPRLKDFGEEFAGNGFTMPEAEKDRDFVTAGDDLLKLNKTFPIGVRFDAYTLFESDAAVNSDLQSPWALKMLSGGNVAKNIGYYFYFFMDERGEVAGVADAYIHFNNIGGHPFDIMVGQFQTSDPLMKRELRLTYEDYLPYKVNIGQSAIDLTYDRGFMTTYDIEATSTGLVAMLTNGNGIPDAYEAESGAKIYDTDNEKNYGFKINQDLGGVAGVGYFYYNGRELGFEAAAKAEDPALRTNEVIYHGADLNIGNGMFDLTFQYLFRRDTNPGFTETFVDVETQGLIAELVISPQRDRSRHYFTLLYNQIDSDWNNHDYESMTAGATYLMARNVRLNVEYTRNLELETNRGVLGLVTGF